MAPTTCSACTLFCVRSQGRGAVEEKQLPNASIIRTQEVNIEKQPLLRFMIMGRKSLPNPARKRRPYRGFVDMVTTNVQDVKAALQGEFGHTRFHPADPPDYLNFEGCEFLLISASDDIEQASLRLMNVIWLRLFVRRPQPSLFSRALGSSIVE
ncbi:uncharacterized protein LOC111480020 [Cucurbita maxima]|uniref:Uncharacterized protein LOC111480020 n=1 Tax=Cucurbita maxima TaxID=3661 RepID=A0A6J1IUF9_CUCMA|nr:uncharacterized protein LOC111480020 [Cucurbita maxima]